MRGGNAVKNRLCSFEKNIQRQNACIPGVSKCTFEYVWYSLVQKGDLTNISKGLYPWHIFCLVRSFDLLYRKWVPPISIHKTFVIFFHDTFKFDKKQAQKSCQVVNIITGMNILLTSELRIKVRTLVGRTIGHWTSRGIHNGYVHRKWSISKKPIPYLKRLWGWWGIHQDVPVLEHIGSYWHVFGCGLCVALQMCAPISGLDRAFIPCASPQFQWLSQAMRLNRLQYFTVFYTSSTYQTNCPAVHLSMIFRRAWCTLATGPKSISPIEIL